MEFSIDDKHLRMSIVIFLILLILYVCYRNNQKKEVKESFTSKLESFATCSNGCK